MFAFGRLLLIDLKTVAARQGRNDAMSFGTAGPNRDALRSLPHLSLLAVALTVPFAPAVGRGPAPEPIAAADPAADAAASRRRERLQAMAELVAAVKVEVLGELTAKQPELVEGARFRFSNPETPCYDATLWLWGTRGRPVAALTLSAERVDSETPSYWSCELTSLSGSRLQVAGDGWDWAPTEAGLDFTPLPDAPAPLETAAGRLRQMKAIARRFDAYGLYDPAGDRRVELRVLPTPVHRYEDPAADIREGALFLLAGGTDPEILLAIELSETQAGALQWQYALNRISSGKLVARLDGRETWNCPALVRPDRGSPYTLFHRPMERELADEPANPDSGKR